MPPFWFFLFLIFKEVLGKPQNALSPILMEVEFPFYLKFQEEESHYY